MNITRTARLTVCVVIMPVILALLTVPLLAGEGAITTTSEMRGEEPKTFETSERVIKFAGQEWIVKSGCGMGPNYNCWSDSEESVWVDDEKQLHLKIRKIDGVWHSAEVYNTSCTKYGMHRFYVIGRLDTLDKNIVAALFLYKDDDHEIDIEFSAWGEDDPETNAQCVVQPYEKPGNREQFSMALNGTHSTHYIHWTASSIECKSIHGHHPEPPTEAHLIHEWSYTGEDIPPETECLKVHMNLWLHGDDRVPSDGQEAEIIVSRLDVPHTLFLPVVPKSPPWITVTAEGDQAWGQVGPPSYCNSDYKVALYAKKDMWYLQPSLASSRVPINSDCTWQSYTHPWDEMAAHLVPADYSPPERIPATSGTHIPPCPPLDPEMNPDVIVAGCYR